MFEMNFFEGQNYQDYFVSRPFKDTAKQYDFTRNLELLLASLDVYWDIAEPIAKSLYARMSGKTLFYHTPVHVLQMLQFAKNHQVPLSNNQILAVYFHDAVYLPKGKAGESEQCSADFAAANLRPFLSFADFNEVYSAILETANYAAWPTMPCHDLVMDLDLNTFSSEYFLPIGDLIRKEFPHVPDEAFDKGRRGLFQKLIDRPSVYRSDFFKERFEAKAQENIKKYLAS